MGDVAHDVHPGSPPEHDDANPHARHALCQMLDRLGGDGVVAWLNGVGVKALQHELYAHVRWCEEHATTPLRERAETAEAQAFGLAMERDEALAAAKSARR